MSLSPENVRELVQKHIEGILRPEEKQDLENSLSRNSEAQKIYVQELRLHAALHLALSGTAQSGTPEQKNQRTKSKRKSKFLRQQKQSNPWPRIAGIAATVLIAVFLAYQFVGKEKTLPEITPEIAKYPKPKSRGTFYTEGKVAIKKGDLIKREVVLITGKKKAFLDLGNYIKVEMAPESKFTLQGKEKKEVVYLEEGEVTCEVDKNIGEFIVKTPVGTVSVQGTKFNVKLIKEDGTMTKKMLVKVLAGVVLVSGAWGQEQLAQGAQKKIQVREKARGCNCNEQQSLHKCAKSFKGHKNRL